MNQRIIKLASATILLASVGCDEVEVIGGAETGWRVVEYLPAPGQFINDGFTCLTDTEAIAWAQSRLDVGSYVPLGTFGGYIVVDAGRDVANVEGADFSIAGNAFSGNSEPGVVWVSADGAEWFQLRGGDTEYPNFSVTYRQTVDGSPGDIHWTDSEGNSGTVNYLPQYHNNSYYPLWVTESEYTLSGTRLDNRLGINESTGLWKCGPYASGYVDVAASDYSSESSGVAGFDISDAIAAGGSPAVLTYIRYVKVQSAVIAPESSPLTGEVSTEVTGFYF